MEEYKIWMWNTFIFFILTIIAFYRWVTTTPENVGMVPILTSSVGIISIKMWTIRERQYKKAKAQTLTPRL